MVDGNDETFSVSRTQHIKAARKPHKCCECGRQIEAGEPYLYCFGVYEGQASHYHVCAHCRVATEWLNQNCGGFLYNGVYEDIEEHTQEGFALGLRRILAGMRRKWRYKSGAQMPIPMAPANYPDTD